MTKHTKKMYLTGECPSCGSENVDYAPVQEHSEGVVYYGVCLDCNAYFQEVNNLEPLFSQEISKNSMPAASRNALEKKLATHIAVCLSLTKKRKKEAKDEKGS